VFVFCLIWFPGMFFIVFGAATENIKINGIPITIGLLFCAVQPIVSTCIAMTTSDVRKYTMNLITLSYIRTSSSSSEEEEEEEEEEETR
jgi:hypothetical protein